MDKKYMFIGDTHLGDKKSLNKLQKLLENPENMIIMHEIIGNEIAPIKLKDFDKWILGRSKI